MRRVWRGKNIIGESSGALDRASALQPEIIDSYSIVEHCPVLLLRDTHRWMHCNVSAVHVQYIDIVHCTVHSGSAAVAPPASEVRAPARGEERKRLRASLLGVGCDAMRCDGIENEYENEYAQRDESRREETRRRPQ